jgi:hypothetical protein
MVRGQDVCQTAGGNAGNGFVDTSAAVDDARCEADSQDMTNPIDAALSHAQETLAASLGREYVTVRANVLELLALYVRVVRPVQGAAPDDMDHWQDEIDSAAA